MRKSKLALLFLLILSLALFTSGCDTLMPDQPPENGETEDGEVTDPSYFVFNEETQTITGYDTAEGPRDVVIPSEIDDADVEVIGEEAFNQMDYLTSVEIPDSVTLIETRAFRSNQLTSVDIGNSVGGIREKAFQTNSLTEVDIPDSVTEIGEMAFQSNELESVVIGDSVEEIKWAAFGDNPLTSVEIGDEVDIHDNGAFEGNFKEVYVDDHNKSAGTYVRDDEESDWYKQS